MYGRRLPSTAERDANMQEEEEKQEEEEIEAAAASSSDDDDDEDIYSLAAQQSTSTTPSPPHVDLSATSLTLIKHDGDVVCVNRGEAPFPTQGYAFFVQKYGAQNAKDLLDPSAAAYADRWLKEARVGFRQRGGGAEEEYDTFLSNGGTCGGRKLCWAVMQIPPGATFHLHMHPTLEIIHVIRGALYERRMVGPPLSLVSEEGKKAEDITPVDLSHLDPPPRFQDNVFSEDSVNVNEMGSVHQSYTSQDEGCLLLCIWAGRHCNIDSSRSPQGFVMGGGCCGSGSSAAGAGASQGAGAAAAASATQVVIDD